MKRFLFIYLIISTSILCKTQVLEQDSLALVAFYNSTNGDNWNNNYNWLDDYWPVDAWFGIEVKNNRIVEIILPYNNLEGNIPTELGFLDSLSILDLSSNLISSIPASIGNLATLDTLALYGCPINMLPAEIGNLNDLKYLNICYTQIPILPDDICNLSKLEYLYGWNGVLQGIPDSIGNMISLKEIDLGVNDISNLPASIGTCTNLIKLQLNANEISEIPAEVGFLTNLEYLILGGNNISVLPDEIFNLSSLRYLNFAANELDTIPSFIGNLTDLENFQFFNNKFTFIPEEIGNCSHLVYINGYGNDIESIPPTIINIPVQTLYLPYNSLTFDDIEPIFYIIGFEYWGQDSVGINIDTTVFIDSQYYMEIQTGGEYNNYQWKKNNLIIEGATNNYLELSNITLADSGKYNCEITNDLATGLTLQSRLINIQVQSYTAIEDANILENHTLKIFPNPFDKTCHINPDNRMNGNYEVRLFNIQGEQINIYQNISGELIIGRDLKKGLYLFKIIENGILLQTGKLIKK